MRTTVDVDDDVLLAVKERARRERRSAGAVISDLARRGLAGARLEGSDGSESFFGFEPLPHRGGGVSNDLLDKLRDEDDE